MTQLPKLLPVVFATVELSILLVVPVGQVVTAHRTSVRTREAVYDFTDLIYLSVVRHFVNLV